MRPNQLYDDAIVKFSGLEAQEATQLLFQMVIFF